MRCSVLTKGNSCITSSTVWYAQTSTQVLPERLDKDRFLSIYEVTYWAITRLDDTGTQSTQHRMRRTANQSFRPWRSYETCPKSTKPEHSQRHKREGAYHGGGNGTAEYWEKSINTGGNHANLATLSSSIHWDPKSIKWILEFCHGTWYSDQYLRHYGIYFADRHSSLSKQTLTIFTPQQAATRAQKPVFHDNFPSTQYHIHLFDIMHFISRTHERAGTPKACRNLEELLHWNLTS